MIGKVRYLCIIEKVRYSGVIGKYSTRKVWYEESTVLRLIGKVFCALDDESST